MKIVVIGLGIQGGKRVAVAGEEVVATVDPVAPGATYRSVDQVPLEAYEAALVCTPDAPKLAVVRYLLSHGKHVLVEKPLLAGDDEPFRELGALAAAKRLACYTAYNHRFEPHLARLRGVLEAGTLGSVYLVRGFYGNGTARDVRQSPWRDQGLGVLPDLGSHLLDMVRFLFPGYEGSWELWSGNRFETSALDHVLFGSTGQPAVELEGTLVCWRNTFTLDVFGQDGSAHIHGLCKWGPSHLILRRRVLPSGRPAEQVETLEQPDPTWVLEYEHFRRLCRSGGTTLDNDRWIASATQGLARAMEHPVSA